jgi:hypothetical protein
MTPKDDDLLGQMRRYDEIASWVIGITANKVVSGVFVENYGFSQNSKAGSRIMESGGIVKFVFFKEHGWPMRPVAQNTARKLLLGKCPQKDVKVAVQNALFSQCKAPRTWTEDQGDAFVIANYGLSEVGGTCLTLATPAKRKGRKG